VVRTAATNVLAPAVASEAAGQLAEGSKYEGVARVAGAIGGAYAPRAAVRTITPFPATPERAAATQVLRNEGVRSVTAGQRTGSHALGHFEAEHGGARYADAIDRQGEEFTRAVLRRAGENADRATPEVVDRAFTRLGTEFDDLQARSQTPFDQQLQDDMLGVVTDYQSIVPQQAPIVEGMMNRIADIAAQNGGRLTGEAYQTARSQLERMARGAQSQPETATALREMREALDDAVERGLAPADVDRWRDARPASSRPSSCARHPSTRTVGPMRAAPRITPSSRMPARS
jgi:hypothetical protein